MKEQIKIKRDEAVQLSHPGVISAARQLGIGLGALFLSRVSLLGSLSPMGVLLAASLPTPYTLSAGLGAFFGYLFFPVNDTPFRYIAAIFAIVCIRLLTAGIKAISPLPPFFALVSLCSLTMCNTVAIIGSGDNALLLLSEGVLCGGLTYFVSRALAISFKKRVGLSSEELSCAVITLDLILICLLPIGVGEFSIGRIAAVIIIIASARFSGCSGGAVSGAAVGFAYALGGEEPILVCVYAISGLIAGLFSSGGRILCAAGFIVPAFLSLAIFSPKGGVATLIIEILFSVSGFLILPKPICTFFASVFSPPTRLESLEGMRKSLVMRLRLASSALGDVSGTIDEVSLKLSRINIPDAGDIFKLCEADACRGCSFRINCWESERDETLKALGDFASSIRAGGDSLRESAPSFSKKCLRRDRMEESLKKHYGEYLSRLDAEERISAVRGAVADQFDGISEMLLDLSCEFDKSRSYDLDAAESIVSALREIDLLTTDCSCSVDKFGRMTVEAKLHNATKMHLSRRRILEQIELSTERSFMPPSLREVGDIVFLTASEKPEFTPEVGVCSLAESASGICGDSYTYFGDGCGRYFMLLSDGMGTGGRAAVDGAMTTGLLERLIRAGFGFDCSLKIVNSALLFKSSEESLSTADIACLDLHTGETSLYKAGAAPTLVRRSGKVGKAESHSLPIGILRDIGFDRSTVTLKKEDIIVIMSDGAASAGTDWIAEELEKFSCGTAQELSEIIAESALRRSDKAHIDDITVMVLIIN